MPDDWSFDPLPAAKYIIDRVASLIGQDPASRQFRDEVAVRQSQSEFLSSRVLIPTMTEPIPLQDIYRILKVAESDNASDDSAVSIDTLINDDTSRIIIAPPGRGKTVSLRYLFTRCIARGDTVPLLYTLIDKGALAELV